MTFAHNASVLSFILLIQIIYAENNSFFFRNSPASGVCLVDILPQSSDPINSTTMEVKRFDLIGNLLNLTVAWKNPQNTRGKINQSQIRITTIQPDQEIAESEYLVIKRLIQVAAMIIILLLNHSIRTSRQ